MNKSKDQQASKLLNSAIKAPNKLKSRILEQALDLLNTHSDINTRIDILINLGDSYTPHKRIQGKIYFEAYTLINSNHLHVLRSKICTRLGNCRHKYHNNLHSINWYYEALEHKCTQRDCAYAYFGLANVFGSLQENQKGLNYITKAITIDPDNKKFMRTKQRLERYIHLDDKKKTPQNEVTRHSLFSQQPTSEYTLFSTKGEDTLLDFRPSR